MLLTSLLYSCKTWTCYHCHIKKLDQFYLCCLCTLLDICWEDRMTNQEVLCHAALPGIEASIMQSQLGLSGHIMHMENNSLPKQLFCSELARGTRKQGHLIKWYKDSLKQSMCACNIPVNGWEALSAMPRAMLWGSAQCQGSGSSRTSDWTRWMQNTKPQRTEV